MLFTELPTAFPFYDRIEKQHRYRENVEGKLAPFGLISPKDSLLPFEFTGSGAPMQWFIHEQGGNLLHVLSSDQSLGLIRQVAREGRSYFYYGGEPLLLEDLTPLDLAEGFYYTVVITTDAVYYSEVFRVPHCRFNAADLDAMEFLKLEWYNNSDLRPIFYNDKDPQGVPYFKNVVYLDSFIHAADPEVQEDGIKDGADETVVTFQKAKINYRVTELVPDFLKIALVVMQMHDVIKLTTRRGIRSGILREINVASALEYGGALSSLEITFTQDLAMIKKNCGDNMTP